MGAVLIPWLCKSGSTYAIYLLPDIGTPAAPHDHEIIRRATSMDCSTLQALNVAAVAEQERQQAHEDQRQAHNRARFFEW